MFREKKKTVLFTSPIILLVIPLGFIDKESNVNLLVHDNQGKKLQVYVQYQTWFYARHF